MTNTAILRHPNGTLLLAVAGTVCNAVVNIEMDASEGEVYITLPLSHVLMGEYAVEAIEGPKPATADQADGSNVIYANFAKHWAKDAEVEPEPA